MKKGLLFIVSSVLVLNLTGCATTSTLTPLQRRVLESKELDGTYEDAFKATIAVLQDQGYVIKTSDLAGGLIYAELTTEVGTRASPGWLLLAPLYGAGAIIYGAISCSKTPYCIRATINLEKFTDARTKMRISLCGIYNDRKTEEITNTKVFQDFFASIQKEMFRRAQLNR